MPSIDIDHINAIIARNTGQDYMRVQALGEALASTQNAPGFHGEFNPDLRAPYVVMLLLALASGADATNAVTKASQYYHLRSTDPDGPPEAGAMVEYILMTFFDREVTDDAKVAFRSEIEVCTTAPAVRMTTRATDGVVETHFIEPDSDGAPSWDDNYVRHGCTIPARVLFRIACDIRAVSEFHLGAA